MNSNMCACNQVQCVCVLPAAPQGPVLAKRGRGRPAGARNARHVDSEGRPKTAAEIKAEAKYETWLKKGEAVASLALAAQVRAEVAAAVSNESAAKALDAENAAAAAAAADEKADKTFAKAAAVQKEMLEIRRKAEAKRQKRAPPPLPAAALDLPHPLELPPGQLPLPPWPTPPPPYPPPHQFVPNLPPAPTIPGMWDMGYPDAFNAFQMTAEQQASLGFFTWV